LEVQAILAERGLEHATVQVEAPGSALDCPTQNGL
jgi:hypothetical protein